MNEIIIPEIVDEDDDLVREIQILTPEQLTFCSAVASGEMPGSAFKKAFPDRAESRWVSIFANRLINSPKVKDQIEAIQMAARMQFILDVPRAAAKMIELSNGAKSEKVQLEATKDCLNRGGLQPPERKESINVNIFGSASSEDIRQLIRTNIQEDEK